MVSARRSLAGLLVWAAAAAGAAVPELPLEHGRTEVDLVPWMATERIPGPMPADPQLLWRGGLGAPVAASGRWELRPGESWAGRVTLRGGRERDLYVLQVPALQLDHAQLWYRREGGTWKSAQAGDRVPLSRWPFPGQFAAFPIHLEQGAVDVVLAAANQSPLLVPVRLLPDELFRAEQVRRANVAGLMTGLAAMVAVVCLLGALVLRQRTYWTLAGVASWTLVTILASNGYLAVWFTGEMPWFNDGARHFFGAILGGLFVALVVDALDPRFVGIGLRTLRIVFPLAGVGYAVAHAVFLPVELRPALGLGWVALAVVAAAAATAVNALRGGRHAAWVGGAVASMALVVLAAFLPPDLARGLDVRAIFMAVALCAGLLLIRQAMVNRDRHGRDVLGRDAVSAHRDPLTALLSQAGFEHAWAEALLREQAGAPGSGLMLIELPGLHTAAAEHGFVLVERALVRLAAALHGALGPAWSVARIGERRLACLCAGCGSRDELQAEATRLLARSARLTHPFPVVAALDMRIACTHLKLPADGMGTVLGELSRAASALAGGKRIAFL